MPPETPSGTANTMSASQYIERRGQALVDGALGDTPGLYRGFNKMVQEAVKDYRGRFLYELIQNGYDAHPHDRRDGRISAIFDDTEGEHGVLYVANGGRPLSRSNFTRLTSMADSDKEIGAGVGNKGVGFKSVYQVCDVPEIYSALEVDGEVQSGLGGFCFRLGTREDIERHKAKISEPRARERLDHLILSLYPVALERVPERVTDLRRDGYVTIIRLAARNAAVAEEIRLRITELAASDVPTMLFLDRLSTLALVWSSGQEQERILSRVEPEGDLPSVRLDDCDEYLLFRSPVEPSDLRDAVERAAEEGSLDKRWLEWDKPAEVSVAVHPSGSVQHPRVYTYLPMGKAAVAPFMGHMNAPFVTDFARAAINADQPVNRLFLTRLAALCIDAANTLISQERHPEAVINLLSWAGDLTGLLHEALAEQGRPPLSTFLRIPAFTIDAWQPLDQVHLWPSIETTVLTRARVQESSGARFVCTAALAEDTVRRLDAIVTRSALSLRPTPAVKADWAEAVASRLPRQADALSTWQSFYDDLPALFPHGADSLQGRKIILTDQLEIEASDQPLIRQEGERPRRLQRAVYFAPRASGSEDDDALDVDLADVPESLRQRIVFMNADLVWHEGAQQTPGRRFLDQARLARPFRTAALLNQLRQLMKDKPTDSLRQDCLRFGFRLFAGNPGKHHKELADVGLEVPTVAGGWLAADQAMFSRGWEVPGAADLSDLLDAAPDSSSELASLAGLLVAPPAALGLGAVNDHRRWQGFLDKLGTRAQLPVYEDTDDRRIYGSDLVPEHVASDAASPDLSAEVLRQWRTGISNRGPSEFPYTFRRCTTPIYWFLGQGEISALPERIRIIYARLVLMTIPQLGREMYFSTWVRERQGDNPWLLETPLRAFLIVDSWVPIQAPDGTTQFARPRDSWWVGVEDNQAAGYSPLVLARLRQLMSAAAPEEFWRSVEFRAWSSPQDARELLAHLVRLIGNVPDSGLEHLARSAARAWRALAESTHALDLSGMPGLLVERTGQPSVMAPDSEEMLFLTTTDEQSTTARMVHEMGWAALRLEAGTAAQLAKLAEHLEAVLPGRVTSTSDWALEVVLDGKPWRPDATEPTLISQVSWLDQFLGCVLKFASSQRPVAAVRLPQHHAALHRMHVVPAEAITLVTPEGPRSLPAQQRGVLPLAGPNPTIVTTRAIGEGWTWPELERVFGAVLELLGEQRFKADASLALRDLRSDGINPADARPTTDQFAAAFDRGPAEITQLLLSIGAELGPIIDRLIKVAFSAWGMVPDEMAQLLGEAHTDLDLLEALGTISDQAESVLSAARASATADELRRRLGVGLAQYNESLVRYFPHDRLVDNSAAQRAEMELRIHQRRDELGQWLREARLPQFLGGDLQTDWPELRSLTFISPDAAWSTQYDEVPVAELNQRIDALVAARVGQRPDPRPALPPYAEVQQRHARPLRQRIELTQALVSVWCEKHARTLPSLWAEGDFSVAIRDELDRVGALDFRELDDDAVALWLTNISQWPEGMTPSLDPESHGLTAADLEAGQDAASREKAERARARKRVSYRGVDLDVDGSLDGLVQQVEAYLSSYPTSIGGRYQFGTLSPVPAATPHKRGVDGSATKANASPAPKRVSNEQAAAIGLIGERIAFEWLRRHDRTGLVDETCWVSRNVRFVFESQVGDDGLGFDFRVPRKKGAVMYEVKATGGPAGQIELGESEVRAAQELAGSKTWRLLIVEHALSDEPRVHMLPNPFSTDARGLFRIDGRGLRLNFRLEGS